ncbi:hypothetical protein DFH27DRAFT_592142 [Peziza echinospora]|nr:hypothetical protein DFH27DRAFT_592142 [Peziza echinospora]
MAVMSSQANPNNDHTKATAPVAAENAQSEETMAMDLDVNGTNKQDDSSTPRDTAPLPSSSLNEAGNSNVNGKALNAPPSPPIPTPPLQISVDGTQDLSDFHITSPPGNAPVGHGADFRSSPRPGDEAVSPGTRMDMDDDELVSPLTNLPPKSTSENSKSSSENKTKSSSKPTRPTVNTDHEMGDAPASVKTGREREEDEEMDFDERPSKRAKTDEPSETPTVSQSTDTGPMSKVQVKFAHGVIRTIRRTKDSGPFLQPVDPVKLNIPTYFDLVKHPMDLSTLEKKLSTDQYANVEEFTKDFKLIISNCIAFNGPDHQVTEMALGIDGTFERQMKTMPPADQPDASDKKSHKKGTSSKGSGSKASSTAPKPARAAKAQTPIAAAASPPPPPPPAPVPAPAVAPPPKAAKAKQVPSKAPKRESKSLTQSQTFALDPSGMPTIRRESVQSDGRPKREIHPPPPRDLPYNDVKPRRKKTAAELKFCDQVLKELLKKQHEAYAYPFYAPVDPVALNIPDYFRIIKKPMDLSTMQNKLKTNQYDSANDFEADMRLMLANCYKFNPSGTAVNNMGKKVEEIFNKKWSEKVAFIQSQSGSRSPVSASPAPEEDEEMSGEEGTKIAELQKKLEMMQDEIQRMKKEKKKTPPTSSQSNRKGKSGPATAGSRKNSIATPAAPPSKKKKVGKKADEIPVLTMEQKTELSQRINLLSASRMMYATKLIQDNMPNLADDDEIELDIDELSPEILYKLHQYVSKHAPPVPVNVDYGYVPPPPPPPPSAPKAKAAPRPKKNKPMSATEQEAKIKDLNAKLAAFENPGLARQMSGGSEEESDSSDDDESSGSESEEE